MSNTILLWIVAVLIILAGVMYWYQDHQVALVPAPAQTQTSQGAQASSTGQEGAGIANPASVNCVQALGGTLEIADTAQGQVGYCHLPDGRVCEEWSLMRGGCTAPTQ